MATKRNRWVYSFCIVLVIALGMVWRSSLVPLPSAVSKYGGDALWSLVVFFGFGFLWPCLSTRAAVILALLFSFAVETSQLFHAPWVDSLRQTRFGALVLGSVFNWPDFAAYTLGIAIGFWLEMFHLTWAQRRQRTIQTSQI